MACFKFFTPDPRQLMETHLTPTLYYLPCLTSPSPAAASEDQLPDKPGSATGGAQPKTEAASTPLAIFMAWKWWSDSEQNTRGLHAHPTHFPSTDAHFMNCRLVPPDYYSHFHKENMQNAPSVLTPICTTLFCNVYTAGGLASFLPQIHTKCTFGLLGTCDYILMHNKIQ